MSDQSKKFSPAGEAGLAVRDIAWLYILKLIIARSRAIIKNNP